MLRHSGKATLAVLVVIAILSAVCFAQPKANPADDAAIKKLVASWSDSFNKKDAHACTMVFVDDADFTSVRGQSDYGYAAVEKHYQMVFSTFLKNAHRTDTVKNIRFLTKNWAVVDSNFEMTGAAAPNAAENAPPVRKGLLSWVVTKRAGQWYIVSFHELDFPR